jgi:hypothetical protein
MARRSSTRASGPKRATAKRAVPTEKVQQQAVPEFQYPAGRHVLIGGPRDGQEVAVDVEVVRYGSGAYLRNKDGNFEFTPGA